METNVGNIDRIARAVIGVVLLLAPFVSGMALFASTTATVISVILGLVMLGTAATRFCLLYRLLGTNTCRSA
jgi:hypothetical protein